MTRMPFTWVEEPDRKPSRLKIVLQALLTVAVLTFCAILVFR
jgi:hypothetical protein